MDACHWLLQQLRTMLHTSGRIKRYPDINIFIGWRLKNKMETNIAAPSYSAMAMPEIAESRTLIHVIVQHWNERLLPSNPEFTTYGDSKYNANIGIGVCSVWDAATSGLTADFLHVLSIDFEGRWSYLRQFVRPKNVHWGCSRWNAVSVKRRWRGTTTLFDGSQQ